MTQEEKAQAYDKAVEVIRKFETDKYGCVIGIKPSDLFQELQESEDEKTRKEITEFFKNYSERGTWKAISDVTRWIAWLEKQAKRGIEPFEAEHGKYYYCIKDYFCGGKKQASKGDVIQALRGLPIMGLKDASEYFLPVNSIKCNSNWSEEDEDMLQSILDEYKSMTTEKRNWLKSIKDIVQPQTKQEWSEEDEKRVESLHGWLDTLVNYIHHDAIVSLDLRRERMQQVERLKTWLEFLKDKVGNFDNGYKVGFSAAKHNQWKPSEEQIRELGIVATGKSWFSKEILSGLLEQIKKLKE